MAIPCCAGWAKRTCTIPVRWVGFEPSTSWCISVGFHRATIRSSRAECYIRSYIKSVSPVVSARLSPIFSFESFKLSAHSPFFSLGCYLRHVARNSMTPLHVSVQDYRLLHAGLAVWVVSILQALPPPPPPGRKDVPAFGYITGDNMQERANSRGPSVVVLLVQRMHFFLFFLFKADGKVMRGRHCRLKGSYLLIVNGR
jgi:hypothetical protein